MVRRKALWGGNAVHMACAGRPHAKRAKVDTYISRHLGSNCQTNRLWRLFQGSGGSGPSGKTRAYKVSKNVFCMFFMCVFQVLNSTEICMILVYMAESLHRRKRKKKLEILHQVDAGRNKSEVTSEYRFDVQTISSTIKQHRDSNLRISKSINESTLRWLRRCMLPTIL